MSLTSALRQQIDNALDRRSTTGNVVQLLFGSGIAQVFTAIATLLITRTLGDAAYGQYAAAYAVATLTSTAFNFGMDNWLLQQARRSDDLPQFTANSLVTRFGLGIIWLVVLVFIAPRLNADTYPAQLVLLIGVGVWFDGMVAACYAYFKATLANRLTALLLILNTGAILITFYALAEQNAPVSQFAWARLAVPGLLLAGLVAWLVFGGRLRLNLPRIPAMLRASIPFALSELFYFIYMRSDVAIIGIRLDSQAVGQYAPASYLISALFLIPSSLYMVMVPVLSQRVQLLQDAAVPDRAPLQAALNGQLRKLAFVTIVVGIGLTAGAFVLGPPLINALLPPTYRSTAEILRTLSLLLFFKTGSFAIGALLVAADLQTERVRWQALIAILSAAVTYVVARPYGITAVAWLYVATEVLLFLGYMVVAGRYLRAGETQP